MSLRARVTTGAVLFAAVVACHGGDHTTAPAGIGTILLEAGGEQQVVAGERLPDRVAVTVVDPSGVPVKGVRVDWAPRDSGTVDPAFGVTDDDGRASTSWTVGPATGAHYVIARADGYRALSIRAMCTPSPLPLDTLRRLDLTTADGSGQTVHPDYLDLRANTGVLRGEFLAITPYPGGNSAFENPAFYTSHDRIQWTTPYLAFNPVATPTAGYLSDPAMVYNPTTDEVWMYYRQVDTQNRIFLIRTQDGIAWTAPQLVAHVPNHELVSPTVVRRSETDWSMWSVNGHVGCNGGGTFITLRQSSNGIDWSDPKPVSLALPSGLTPWHVYVQWIPSRGEYWAVYNVKTAESCSTPALYLATSTDGMTWVTYPSPLLALYVVPEFRDVVYRATFSYSAESDIITFWYSGAQYNGSQFVWSTMVQRRRRGAVFDGISLPASAASASISAPLSRKIPLLLDPP